MEVNRKLQLSRTLLDRIVSHLQWIEDIGEDEVKVDCSIVITEGNTPMLNYEISYKPTIEEDVITEILNIVRAWNGVETITHFLSSHRIEVTRKMY